MTYRGVNALAESTIGQIKTELIKPYGPWRTIAQLEYALFEYLDWWNHRRLHGQIDDPTGRSRSHPLPSEPATRQGRFPMNQVPTEPRALQDLLRSSDRRCGQVAITGAPIRRWNGVGHGSPNRC